MAEQYNRGGFGRGGNRRFAGRGNDIDPYAEIERLQRRVAELEIEHLYKRIAKLELNQQRFPEQYDSEPIYDTDGEVEEIFNMEYVPEPCVEEDTEPIYDTDGEEEEEEDETDSTLPEEGEESKGLLMHVAEEIICDPFVRKHVCSIYQDTVTISTSPTFDGKVEINAYRQYAWIKWLKDLLNHSLDKKEYVYIEPFDIVDSRTSLSEEKEDDAYRSVTFIPDVDLGPVCLNIKVFKYFGETMVGPPIGPG